MEDKTIAFVFAHPAAHELLVTGLIQSSRSHLLFLTQADSASPQSSQIARETLEKLELCESMTFLEMSEIESYSRAFAADFGFYADYRNRILDWLFQVQPDVVIGDAQECYNFHHDLTRVLLDDAHREYSRKRPSVQNYEFANVCRTSDDLNTFLIQQFPSNRVALVHDLDEEQVEQKKLLLQLVGERKQKIFNESVYYDFDREVYREVPIHRDYSIPPTEFKIHFEEWGQEQVRRGKYVQALLYDQHFAPIARYLSSKSA